MDEEILEIMVEHDLEEDQAEHVQELVNDGMDEDDAVEIVENEE